jgi:hypothetical protein
VVKPAPKVEPAPSRPKFGLRDLFRIAIWAASAAIGVFIALYAATTETGHDRMFMAFAEIHEVLMPTGEKPIRPLDAREGRRLAETVRSLAADRDRLLARVATLEQSLDGVTGSIARVEKATRATPGSPAPSVVPAAPVAAAPAPSAPPAASAAPPEATPSRNAPDEDLTSSIPMPQPAPNLGPAKAEYGLDLGSATTVEALRTAWTAALRRHGPLLEGLRPLVLMRERPRPNGMELRLIAGPVPSAAAAARLCVSMTAAGGVCAPSVFEGQRLAVR